MKDESEADAGAVRCGAVRSKVRIGMLTEKTSYMAYHIHHDSSIVCTHYYVRHRAYQNRLLTSSFCTRTARHKSNMQVHDTLQLLGKRVCINF